MSKYKIKRKVYEAKPTRRRNEKRKQKGQKEMERVLIKKSLKAVNYTNRLTSVAVDKLM